jgi:hypothetical protein
VRRKDDPPYNTGEERMTHLKIREKKGRNT